MAADIPMKPWGWDEAPSYISDLSTRDVLRTEHVIDPWNIVHRLGALKIVMVALDEWQPDMNSQMTQRQLKLLQPGMEKLKPTVGNPFWGIALQTDWQNRSGRHLYDPHGALDPESFWSAGNYMLTVVPLLVAIETGFVKLPYRSTMIVSPPPCKKATMSQSDEEVYCTTYEQCKAVFPEPSKLFEKLFHTVMTFHNSLPRKECIKLLWDAHDATIKDMLSKVKYKLSKFSRREADFTIGWCLMVNFFADVEFESGFAQISKHSASLPFRCLQDTDGCGCCASDLPAPTKKKLLLLACVKQAQTRCPGLMGKVFNKLSEEKRNLAFDTGTLILYDLNDCSTWPQIARGILSVFHGFCFSLCCCK